MVIFVAYSCDIDHIPLAVGERAPRSEGHFARQVQPAVNGLLRGISDQERRQSPQAILAWSPLRFPK